MLPALDTIASLVHQMSTEGCWSHHQVDWRKPVSSCQLAGHASAARWDTPGRPSGRGARLYVAPQPMTPLSKSSTPAAQPLALPTHMLA